MEPQYHVVERWQTPATHYPRQTKGDWEISTRVQGEGVYPLQTFGSFYYVPRAINLTVLKEGGKVWFTDEPRNMYALAEIGLFRAHGRVIVGGLGLGLIHHFLGLNPAVTSILTIERGCELKDMVWPYLNPYRRGELVIGDFYEELPKYEADTVIVDFIFGYQNEATWRELEGQREFCQTHLPKALFLEHGYQRKMDAEIVAAAIPSTSLLPVGVMPGRVEIFRGEAREDYGRA